MDKSQEKRLNDLARSSIVGGDIKAALEEIATLRSLEKQYSERLGKLARLSDTVCKYLIEESERLEFPFSSPERIPAHVLLAANEIMEYVDAVRP